MTSVDSGVETGNDSNDSLSVQHESQKQHVAVYRDSGLMSISPINCNEEKEEYNSVPPHIQIRSPNDLILNTYNKTYKNINLWMLENSSIPGNEWENMFQQAVNAVKELPYIRVPRMEITGTVNSSFVKDIGWVGLTILLESVRIIIPLSFQMQKENKNRYREEEPFSKKNLQFQR